MKSVIIFVSVVFLFLSCKKEKLVLPEGNLSESPIFVLEGNVGGYQINLNAGVEGAVLKTFQENSFGVNQYIGKFENSNSNEVFQIVLNDGKLDLNTSFEGKYGSNLGIVSEPSTWFYADVNIVEDPHMVESIYFQVDGVVYANSVELNTPGYHYICVIVQYFDGSSEKICNNVLIGYKDYGFFRIIHTNTLTGTKFSIESEYDVSSVKWYLGNQLFSEQNEVELALSSTVKEIKAEVTFTNGITRTHSIAISEYEAKFINDIHNGVVLTNDSNYHDFKVDIYYLNEGKQYKALNSVMSAPFMIENIELFEEKSNGNKVYKIVGSFNGQFEEISSGNLLPSQIRVTFAIEHP